MMFAHTFRIQRRVTRAVAWPAAAAAFALAAVPASAQSGGSPGEAMRVLERAAERYESLDAFCADFEQEIDVTLLRRIARSSGELCQERPDRFEMLWEDPAGDRVVADGTDLWVYFPSTDEGQVFRSRMAASDGRFDLHREFLSDPGERYRAGFEGTERLNGIDTYVLALEPRIPSPYVHARVWIDTEEYLVRRLVILEDSESVRTLDLSNIRLNPAIPPARFRFDPPPGAQVINR